MGNNLTKKLIHEGKPVLGTFLCLNSSAVAEVMSRSGFDYLTIDMEHGLMGIDTANEMITAIRGTGVTPIIRVEKNDEAIINRALDASAYGIMVPMVNTAEEAERAVKACKYPPEGIRGVGPGHMCLYGINIAEYQKNANRRIMTILQAEHIDAVNNIEEILDVEGIDVIFIGPSDLASSMNLLGQVDHPLVEEAIQKIASACKRKNVAMGIYCVSIEASVERIKQGFQFITYGLDSKFLGFSSQSDIKEIKSKI